MDFEPDMVRDETNDPLAIRSGNRLARVNQTICETDIAHNIFIQIGDHA